MAHFARLWYDLEEVSFSASAGSLVGQEMYGSRIECYAALHGPEEPSDQDREFAAYMAENEFPF